MFRVGAAKRDAGVVMDRILVTGATGFVGRPLVEALAGRGYQLVLASRGGQPAGKIDNAVRAVEVGDIGPRTEWSEALDGCSIVIHLAARTPSRGVPPQAYASVNDQGTARLAEQAAKTGVRLFVFMSSLHAITADAVGLIGDNAEARPVSPYAVSKFAAEGHIEKLAEKGIAAVSLRPPLVVGAEAAGNWRLIQKLAASRLPLPVAGLRKPRSVISVDNLVDAVAAIVKSGASATSGRFLVADPEPVSLAEMVRLLRQGMNLPARIFGVPEPLIAGALSAVGRGALAHNLFGHIEVDSSRFGDTFGWSPKLTTAEGIVKSGRDFSRVSR
jgi:UDP-glucose 4-epimerase